MADDIVPTLLAGVLKQLRSKIKADEQLRKILQKVESHKANYDDAHTYSIRVGELLRDTIKEQIQDGTLPNNTMYYNIASRLIPPPLEVCHDNINQTCQSVQQDLNEAARIGINAQPVALNQDRVNGLVYKVSGKPYEMAMKFLDEPIVNFCQSIVDSHIRTNADFHFRSGLSPKIERVSDGHCCEWCSKLAGTYDYKPDMNRDVFRRHQNCRCTTVYDPGKGKQVQDVWTKQWKGSNEENSISNTQVGNELVAIDVNGMMRNQLAHKLVKMDLMGIPLRGEPNSYTDIRPAKHPENITRNYYGPDGRQNKQITIGDHGNPGEHPFGEIGEHGHDYEYDEYGNLIRGKARELTIEERKEFEDEIKIIKIKRDNERNNREAM